jgi:hypothetical protein
LFYGANSCVKVPCQVWYPDLSAKVVDAQHVMELY